MAAHGAMRPPRDMLAAHLATSRLCRTLTANNMGTWLRYACFLPALGACSGKTLVVGGGGDSGCVPGIYTGTFECGGGPDASSLGGRGQVSIRLEGDWGGKTLNVAPGTKLTASQAGAVFSVDLSGTLDCTTNRLEGRLQNGMSSMQAITIIVNETGTISADYDASATPPALVAGVFDQPGFASLSSACTWSATLQ
jgi:hypothetical protein